MDDSRDTSAAAPAHRRRGSSRATRLAERSTAARHVASSPTRSRPAAAQDPASSQAVQGDAEGGASQVGGSDQHDVATPHRGSDDHGTTLAQLAAAVEAVRSKPVDELDEPALGHELRAVEKARRQLDARQARLAATLSARAAARARTSARQTGRGEDAADQHARRQVQRELSGELGWSPAEAKRAADLGRRLEPSGPVGKAFDTGSLPQRHAAVLADTLRWIDDPAQREQAEADLLPLAAEQDPVMFGRTCRRLLASLDPEGSEQSAERRRVRRKASAWQQEDGMLGVSARLAGLDGEMFATAFHAFRRPDSPDEVRTPDQAGADALVAMARAALNAGTAPTDRGVRPHLTVLIDWETIASNAGIGEGVWTGPIPLSEIRKVLADCGVSRLLTDAAGTALEAGKEVRTVPAGVRRATGARDGVCIGDGCDVPARYCQVMHLKIPYRLGGRLTVDTAALGCPYHHDAFDRRGWVITWRDARPILHHPDRPPGTRRLGGSADSSDGSCAPQQPGEADGASQLRPPDSPDGSSSPSPPDGRPPDRSVRSGASPPHLRSGAPSPRPADDSPEPSATEATDRHGGDSTLPLRLPLEGDP